MYIAPLCCDQPFNLRASQQRPRLDHIAGVSAGTEQTPNRLLRPLDKGMKLGGSTMGTIDRLGTVILVHQPHVDLLKHSVSHTALVYAIPVSKLDRATGHPKRVNYKTVYTNNRLSWPLPSAV